MDVEKIRQDFPILNRQMGNKRMIYLVNASTTQKPRHVINVMSEYYNDRNSNISISNKLSNESKKIFEASRERVASFINADPREIIFTKNATEAINLVAYSYGRTLKKKSEIITSVMEQHANIVPWQMLEKEIKIKLRFAKLHENKIDTDDIESLICKKTGLVTVNHVSNVLGIENGVEEIVRIAHDYDVPVLLDGAQSVPRIPVDVKKLGCDFLAFTGHKMLGPQGIGCLYVKRDIMKKMKPFICGGLMKKVTKSGCKFLEDPYRFEPGMQNIAGALGFGAAIEYLQKIGMKNIEAHNNMLMEYALNRMRTIDGVKFYGYGNGIVAFDVKQLQCHDVANLMGDEAIMISAGHHCCMPLMEYLDTDGIARMSTYVYNTKEEIDKFIERLKKISSLGTKRMIR